MGVSTFVQPNFPAQSATVYKTSIDDAVAVHHQIAGAFAPHEQAVPNLTVRLDAANFSDLITRTTVTHAAQDTASLTAPSVDPRKDIVFVDRITGDVGVIAGAEAPSPVDPVIPLGKLPVARINWTTSMTEIANADLDDIRVLGGLGSPITPNLDGGLTLTNTDDGAGAGPLSVLDRNSSSPTVSDFIGARVFRGRSSTDADVDYAELAAQIILATNGSEDARMILRAMIGGSLTDIITAGPGVQVGAPSGADQGAGTLNMENGIYANGVLSGLVLEAEQATTSGATKSFTGLRPGLNQLFILFRVVTLTSNNDLLIQIGDSEGLETSGYSSTALTVSTVGVTAFADTTGFILPLSASARSYTGIVSLARMSGNNWVSSFTGRLSALSVMGGGSKTLTGELDRVSIVRISSGTFDGGAVTVLSTP